MALIFCEKYTTLITYPSYMFLKGNCMGVKNDFTNNLKGMANVHLSCDHFILHKVSANFGVNVILPILGMKVMVS